MPPCQICQKFLYLEDFVEEYPERISAGQTESPFQDLTVWGRTLLAWLLEMGKATAQSTYLSMYCTSTCIPAPCRCCHT